MNWLTPGKPKPAETPKPLDAAARSINRALSDVSNLLLGVVQVKDVYFGDRWEQIQPTPEEIEVLKEIQAELAWIQNLKFKPREQ